MKLQYLGTAAAEAFPSVFCHCDACVRARRAGGKNIRGRSGALIDGHLMVDFPPDIYFQSLRLHIDLGGVKDLVVTHSHSDHFCVGEFMLRDQAYFTHLPAGSPAIAVYGNANVELEFYNAVKKMFGEIVRAFAVFSRVKPFEPFVAGDIRVTPLEAVHDPAEHCMIYIFERGEKRILYAHDTSGLTEKDWAFIQGMRFQLISLDCNNGGGPGSSAHMGIREAAAVRERLVALGCIDGNTRAIINHFSHNCGLLHHELEAIAAPAGFTVSYDGMAVEL